VSKSTRFIQALIMGFVITIVGLSSPSLAFAEEPGPASIGPPAPEAPQIEHRAYWTARADAARERVAALRTEMDEANAAVSRMRRRNHPRGDARLRLQEEQRRARAAFEAAQNHLEVELPAEARQAGAPRHWLHERS